VELSEKEVAVHLLPHREPVEEADITGLAHLLDEDERSRRFHFERDRHAFVLAHAFLRRILSCYRPVLPASWRFQRGTWGKPEIAGQPERPLQFSLSHTKGCIACAVTRGQEVGIDVERTGTVPDELAFATRFFSPPDAAMLASLHGEVRTRRFYELWTLREAYAKARGLGLSMPLDRVAFTFDDPTAPRIAPLGTGQCPPVEGTVHCAWLGANPGPDDETSDWRFERFLPTTQHQVALAVRGRAMAVRATVEKGAMDEDYDQRNPVACSSTSVP
jgi:4'-phosphopantetheinyl transferase